jgi:hypothetical protein
MLPQGSHITRKRGVCHYRRRLPSPYLGEVTLSLRTRHFREAEHLAGDLDAAFRRALRVVSDKGPHHADVRAVVLEYLRNALEADLALHQRDRPGRAVYSLSVPQHVDPVDADAEIISHLLADAREALARRDYRSVADTVDRLARAHDIPDDLRTELAHGVLRANVEALEEAERRVVGDYPPLRSADAPAPVTATKTTDTAPRGPLLSTFLPTFVDQMVTQQGWTGQTKAQNEPTYRMFTEWCGDRAPKAYAKSDLADFHDMLLKLPALYSKDARWRGLSLREVLEQSAGVEVNRVTMKTVKRHFSALGRLFRWLKRRDAYAGENPAHGLDFATNKRGGTRRLLWEAERLRKLFASPVWTGCPLSPRKRDHRRLSPW